MRVFVTGASGFIGSAVVPELLGAGHQVTGLARSDASARALETAGAQVRRGSLDDLESLHAGAAESDGVIHLAYIHDFSRYEDAGKTDRLAIETMGSALAGTGKPLVIASGTLGVTFGRLATEQDMPDPAVSPRMPAAELTLALAGQEVRSSVLRLPPSVHNERMGGFTSVLVQTAKDKGLSGYVGDGSNRWPAVHVLDVATLFRLAVEKAPAGSVLHGVGDEGIPIREVAEVIGRHLGLPVAEVPADDVAAHFAWMVGFIGADSPASNERTRRQLDWQPSHPGLLHDLENGHYYE